ncbi:MAG: glycosyltransferase family 4 protein [Bacteroidetes bacterium]|nr:glycosyltransferase family 4 protein [Bacteroidota bacterium]
MSKIILDCDLMRYRNSGLYHYCLSLGIFVQNELEKSGNEISMYVPKAEKDSFGKNCNTITERKWHKKFPVKPFLWGCDIWHNPFQSGRMVPVNRKKTKVLLTIHDLNVLHEPVTESNKIKSLQHTQQLINKSDVIVCISHHTKNDVMTHMDTGNKPLYVIHNGTHQVTQPPTRPVSYEPNRPFLFTMGYVNRKKNFHTLVPLLKDTSRELIIAGKLDDPDYVSGIWNQARQLGVADRVHIPGPVPEEDKAWYFKNCESFLFPSLAEGFGAPVVEAMTFGKPLFLSNRTSLLEVAGDVAFYFRNFEADHMRQVYYEGMKEYGRNGLREKIIARGSDFSWERSAAKYVEVYKSMM